MNGRKAKKLRKFAQELSVGKPKVQYEEKALNRHRPFNRTRFLHDCTRLIYRNLKKQFGHVRLPF